MSTILTIAHCSSYGGTRTYLVNLFKLLAKTNDHVIIATETPSEVSPLVRKYLPSATIINLPVRPFLVSKTTYLLHCLTAIYELIVLHHLIRRVSPDLLIVTPTNAGDYLSSICLNIPKIMVIHSYPTAHLPWCYQLLQNLGSHTTTYLSVSNFSQKQIIKYHFNEQHNQSVKFIYNPGTKFVSHSSARRWILTLGHMEAYKDPLIWVETIKKITNLNPKFPYKFVWVGDGKLKNQTIEAIKNYHLEQYCQILPPNSNVKQYIVKAKLYFQPSRLESQGISVADALSSGIPCVVAEAGGMPEMVHHETSGLVVDVGDSTAMAQAILRLVNNDNLYQRFAREALSWTARNLSHEIWEKQMGNLIHDLKKDLINKSIPTITIFTIPKPNISKHIWTIQNNALRSWNLLSNSPRIMIVGQGKDIGVLSKEFHAIHLPKVKTTNLGTPLLNDAFKKVTSKSKDSLLMYTNADMIYGQELIEVLKLLPSKNFLAVGSRWDLNLSNNLNTSGNWWDKLIITVKKQGKKHPPMGSDYFIFRRGDFVDLPPFAVGRVRWDNWMIEHAIKLGMQVIDISPMIIAIHQNHDHSHQVNSGHNYLANAESRYNISLSGQSRPYTLLDTNYQLTPKGLERKNANNIIKRTILWLKNILA